MMKNIINKKYYIDTGSIAGDSTAFVNFPTLAQDHIDALKKVLGSTEAMQSKITIWPLIDIEEDDG